MAAIAARRMDTFLSRWPGFQDILRLVFSLERIPATYSGVPALNAAGQGLMEVEQGTAAAIDRCYDDLAELVGLRGGPEAGPALEAKIAQAFQRLRSLQEQEAEVTRRAALSRLSLPLHGGADRLAHIDELLARYEDPAPDDRAAAGADPQEA